MGKGKNLTFIETGTHATNDTLVTILKTFPGAEVVGEEMYHFGSGSVSRRFEGQDVSG